MVALELIGVRPAYLTHPDYHTTLGPEAADFGDAIGFSPDADQRMLLDVMYGVHRDGSPCAFEFCIICARQNLKTGTFKIAGLFDIFVLHDPLFTWTAHLFDTTEDAFLDIKTLIDGSYMLSRRVRKITEGNGDEEIVLTDGCRMQFKARGKSGGRGKSGNKVLLDEALYLKPAHIGSLYPTTATKPNAQIRLGSSAGLPDSAVLRDVRDRGRKGGDPSLAYVEYADLTPPSCAEPRCTHHRDTPGCCLDDPERLRSANPALGRRITMQRLQDFRRAMPPEEFAREFLGWWDEPASAAAGFDFSNWAGLADPDARPARGGRLVFGIAVSPGQHWAAVSLAAAASAPAGVYHVETGAHREGVDWLPKFCATQAAAHPGAVFVIDGGLSSPAEPQVRQLREAGVPIEVVGAQAQANGTALLTRLVRECGLRHRDQRSLNAAIRAARPRNIGDGAVALGRRASGEDITPAESVALALYGYDALNTRGPNVW